jgi:hypothetical protein
MGGVERFCYGAERGGGRAWTYYKSIGSSMLRDQGEHNVSITKSDLAICKSFEAAVTERHPGGSGPGAATSATKGVRRRALKIGLGRSLPDEVGTTTG